MTVGQVLAFLQSRAPFETAEGYDNVGLLVGSPDRAVDGILVTLDITPAAVREAARIGAGLIVSHHPVIFSPLRTLDADSVPALLIQGGIAAICAHTNLDRAAGGVNDCLAAALGLADVRTASDGLTRFGRLPKALSPRDFAAWVGKKLGTAVRMRTGTGMISNVAVCSGAGGDFLLPILEEGGAVAAVTGELKHHEWLALPAGVTMVEAGHYHTEICMVNGVAAWLREGFPEAEITAFEDTPPYETV